jgi:transcription antitermination factor NusG
VRQPHITLVHDISWFALSTRSRAEKAARDYLEAHAVETFLPTFTRQSRWKDRKKSIEWPLFAGYCFARFDPREQLTVLKCPHVAAIVSCAGTASPVPEIEIQNLRTLMASELQFDPVPFIKEGDKVQVVHGPLKGVVGRLVRKGQHARLVLAVDLISQAVSVTVDASDVKAY